MDQGPDGELMLCKPTHSAKCLVVQSPGSKQDAPPKQRLQTIKSANAEMSVDASTARENRALLAAVLEIWCNSIESTLIWNADTLCRQFVDHAGMSIFCASHKRTSVKRNKVCHSVRFMHQEEEDLQPPCYLARHC